jgi:hypothetical protein
MKAKFKKYLLRYPIVAGLLVVFALVVIAKAAYNASQEAAHESNNGSPGQFWNIFLANIRYVITPTDLQY